MKLRKSVALVAMALAVTPIALAVAPKAADISSGPVVVELFTSQSCSSCPPAEALLGQLAGRSDLIALEFHVDYWNDLVHGAAGRWTDVHSDPAYTARQRSYAERLPGGVYTPQMVIDGRLQAVGSRARDVEAAIAAARKVPRLQVSLTTSDAGKTELRVSGAAGVVERDADIWLVRFRDRVETKVRAGENRGKALVNHHIVTGAPLLLGRLGGPVFDAGSTILKGVSFGLNEGCAVLVQAPGQGPILGAARCPAVAAKAS